jgi:rhodanese-related sulfurtransferase
MNDQIKHYKQKLEYEIDSSDLFEAINAGELIIVIDARKPFAFNEEHIPLANNFPHREMTEESTKKLDRNILYVTYCDGIGCNASTKGALKMAQLGFKVKELIGGLDWWKRDGYATQGTKSKVGLKLNCAC